MNPKNIFELGVSLLRLDQLVVMHVCSSICFAVALYIIFDYVGRKVFITFVYFKLARHFG